MDANTPAETVETTTPELGPMAEFGAALDRAAEIRADKPSDEGNSDSKPADDDRGTRSATDDAERARRAENNRNAQRRIQRRREQQNSRNRISELERQAREREQAGDPDAAVGIRERIADMQASVADTEYNDFYDRAVDELGDGADSFVQQTLRYSKYVNAAEPELLQMTSRPKGLVLLHEWMKRMDVPKLRQEWLDMIPAEKQQVLMKFYDQIIKRGERPSADAKPQQTRRDVPVPGSGRNVKGLTPDDDFGLLLQEAKNRRVNSRR